MRPILLLGLVAGALLLLRGSMGSSDWKNARNAAKYLPLLNAAERKYGIPTDLLARLAYQESRFRDDIVSGATPSSAGALGIMQLVPKYHPNARPLEVIAAVDYGASFLASLRRQLGSWRLALAGYNAGAGNVIKYKGIPPFEETQKYVREITADVPV